MASSARGLKLGGPRVFPDHTCKNKAKRWSFTRVLSSRSDRSRPKQISVVLKSEKQKKKKKVLSSFCNFPFSHLPFLIFLLFFSIFPFFLPLFPGRSAEISPGEVSRGTLPSLLAVMPLLSSGSDSNVDDQTKP